MRPQARARDTPLRVSSISPGIVETEFLAVHSFGDEAAAKERCARGLHAQSCCHVYTCQARERLVPSPH